MSRETVARCKCHACGGDVAVKQNVSKKAYYSCDHCGVKVQHTWQRSSDAFLAKIAPPAPKADPAPLAERTPAGTSTVILPKPATLPRGSGTVLG